MKHRNGVTSGRQVDLELTLIVTSDITRLSADKNACAFDRFAVICIDQSAHERARQPVSVILFHRDPGTQKTGLISRGFNIRQCAQAARYIDDPLGYFVLRDDQRLAEYDQVLIAQFQLLQARVEFQYHHTVFIGDIDDPAINQHLDIRSG